MNRDRLKYLLDVCKSQRATSEERIELENWYESFDNNADVTDLLDEEYENRIRLQIWDRLEASPELTPILNKGIKQINVFQSFFFRAASIALIVGLSVYLLMQGNSHPVSPEDNQEQIIADIAPGGNNATLTLADGSVVDLQSIESGKVIQQNGLSVIKTQDGQIAYKAEPTTSAKDIEITYNTIKTPRGGQYQIVLPDGTLVWLNAASSLTYPTRFESSERVITLSGEAYIEVSPKHSKDGKRVPFKVRTKNQEIQVLGTHFNVKAYEDEKETFTTLLEGKVKVIGFENGTPTGKERVLKIGETASWDNNTFDMSGIALEKVIAWKNGKFIFTGDNVKSIMKDVSRWYDVDISYTGDLSNVNFEGSLSRYANISEILRKLELTGTVRFKVVSEDADPGKGRRIEVMQ